MALGPARFHAHQFANQSPSEIWHLTSGRQFGAFMTRTQKAATANGWFAHLWKFARVVWCFLLGWLDFFTPPLRREGGGDWI